MRSPSSAAGSRLHQVVDPGGPAAQLPVGGLHQFEAGNPAQQLARLGAHALGVGEVAGVVVGDLHLDRAPLGTRAGRGEELGHVADAGAERARRGRPTSGSSRSTWP